MIPVTLFTGFLGAGKTTMLAHLLRQREARGDKQRLVLIINEFATLGLDAVQLPRGQYDVFELNRGSIFCICLRSDFIALLERVIRELAPDEIWVETTGVADVSEVFKMMSVPGLRGQVYVRTNVCVIDPHTILKVLVTLKAAREQVACADVLVINKMDTCTEAEVAAVEGMLRTHNRHAPFLRTQYGAVDIRALPSSAIVREDLRPFEGHATQPISSVSICEAWTLDAGRLREWLTAHGEVIWRAKGRLQTPEGMQWLDATLHEVRFRECPQDYTLPAPTSLAFVGPGLSRELVEAGLTACRVDGGAKAKEA
ncbi:MAG: GTP-binding protein [bacterium]|nr:GTP-binding protein [bacterium]